MSEFFNMGGYAVFVWSSYGLALIVMVLNWWLPYQQHKQNIQKLKRTYKSNKREERSNNDTGT